MKSSIVSSSNRSFSFAVTESLATADAESTVLVTGLDLSPWHNKAVEFINLGQEAFAQHTLGMACVFRKELVVAALSQTHQFREAQIRLNTKKGVFIVKGDKGRSLTLAFTEVEHVVPVKEKKGKSVAPTAVAVSAEEVDEDLRAAYSDVVTAPKVTVQAVTVEPTVSAVSAVDDVETASEAEGDMLDALLAAAQ